MERMTRNTTDISTNSQELPMNMGLSSTKIVCCQTDLHNDPQKVSAVYKMAAPKTATQLQKFIRLVTYLSPFIPPLSFFTAPLHGLLKNGTEFIWNNSYKEAFDKVKSMACKHTTLQYLNICKPVTVQVDAPQKGLGAALLQDGFQVAFASKALMSVEQCYANIECELLACVLVPNDSTHMSLAMPLLLRVTTSLLNRSTSRI